MYTQCPHCQTIFGVSDAHLSAAYGRVRCGQCRGQFNAKRHLLDELPEQPRQTEAANPPGIDPQAESTADMQAVEIELADVTADELEHTDLSNPASPPEQHTTAGLTAAEFTESDTADTQAVEIELADVTADEVEHIDLPNPASPSEQRAAAELAGAEPPEITRLPPQLDDRPEKEELDAIFAALDDRLEELSGNTDEAVIKPFEEFETGQAAAKDYQDAFGDPDSQSEADIKSSIETIFAAAEAELDEAKTTAESEKAHADENPQAILATDADPELSDSEARESEPSSEDVFIIEAGAEVENIELATGGDESTLTNNDDEPISEQAPTETEAPSFEQEELPFMLHDDLQAEHITPRSWLKTAGLSSLVIVLLLAVGFQLALFRNVELANRLPVLKPYLLSFCQHLPCQFSGQRDIKQIQLTSRDVRTHPKGKNTILINAIFVNNAHFDQPYPDILITLSDLTTTVIAQRRFTPQDYLARAANTFQLMKSGKPVHISLEVLDPGNDAVNFQFEFM